MKRLFLLFTLCICMAITLHAQLVNEICNNGVDDDGDGFVDCFDNQCSGTPVCTDNYVHDVGCTIPKGPNSPFKMTLDWESQGKEVVNHLNRVSIGDLDRDGVPEVVATNITSKRIYILNGRGGATINFIDVTYDIDREPLIGNIDNDGCAEIFTFGKEGGVWKIFAYDCKLLPLWSSPVGSELSGNPIFLSLANFDGDDKVELYCKDEIIDAHTGIKIVKSMQCTDTGFSSGTGITSGGKKLLNYDFIAAPVAVNIVGTKDLELVAGCRIYSVNLGSRTLNSGSLTLLDKHDSYRMRDPENSTTSIADYNDDGFLDVVATGSEYTGAADRGNISIGNDQNTTVFFWDAHNGGSLKTYIDRNPLAVDIIGCSPSRGTYYKDGWEKGAGRINLGDIDGDGQLNAVYVSGKYLYALKQDWTQQWRTEVIEETSGYTGITMFDFNGDGKTEIVYRDEKYLYIVDGTTGALSTSVPCRSRTNRDYPIVADVDADGSTEICVTCAVDDNISTSDFCGADVGNQRSSVVRAYKSAADPWVPARRVWNQHAYFNININDDLSIPKQQQDMQQEFPKGSCNPGGLRPLNNFLNQSPYLNSYGCPQYAGSDFKIIGAITVDQPTCPGKDFNVNFSIQNVGDLSVSGTLPITFYKSDPRIVGAIRLNTVSQVLNSFGKSSPAIVVNTTVQGDGTNFTLFIVLNDAGTSIPPIDLKAKPNTSFIECNYDYFSTLVTPKPVTVTTIAKPNVQCIENATSANGSVTASIVVNGIDISSGFNFYWSIGATAKPVPADYVGATYTGLLAKDYTVFAIHKTANCNSDTKVQPVLRVDGATPTITINIVNSYTNCKIPNGSLRAIVNGGQPVNNFLYNWYQGGQAFGTVINSTELVTGLVPNTYTVVVIDKATACQGILSEIIPDQTVKPIATVQPTDVLCSDPNSGTLTAGPAGFNYRWYNGNSVKPTPDYPNTMVNGLRPAGSYTLVIEDITTKCISDPVQAVINPATPPQLNAPVVNAQNTSCDVLLPNGSASASVMNPVGGHTYVIKWFKGQNTSTAVLPSTQTGTTSTINNLSQGIYTVQLIDGNCSSKQEVTINFMAVTPTLTLAPSGDLTSCLSANGFVLVNVSAGSPSDYTFTWYKGITVKPVPDVFTDNNNDNRLDNVPIGKYTVKAVNNFNHCTTAPVTGEVKDARPTININLNAIATLLPSDCNSNKGEMAVDVSAAGNVSGFKIEWFKGFTASGPSLKIPADMNVTSSVLKNLGVGVYTVLATNLDNGCSTSRSFDLPYANGPKLTLVNPLVLTKCSPTNTNYIEVQIIPATDPTGVETYTALDYKVKLIKGKDDTGTLLETIAGIPGNTSTSATLDTGFYYLVAITDNPALTQDGCPTNPVIAQIKQDVSYPSIKGAPVTANKNCAGAMGSGSITLDIDGPAPETDYSYSWFNGASTTDPTLAGAVNENAPNLVGGMYTVKVTTTTALNQNCSSEATFQVFDNPLMISMSAADLLPVDGTMCPLALGSASVVSLTETDGGSVGLGNIGDYTFEWRDNTLAVLPSITNTIANLAPGTYFVKASKNVPLGMNCGSDLVEFKIEDKTMNTIVVDVTFVLPTSCFKPADIPGQLTAIASGPIVGATYGYTWYSGNNTSGVVVSSTAVASINLIANNFYTVEVVNNANKCRTTETYQLIDDPAVINLQASTLPITFCVPNPSVGIDDGAVYATVISLTYGVNPQIAYKDPQPLSDFYDFYWTKANGTPINTPDPLTGHQNTTVAGNYTVYAQDKLRPTCKSAPVTVTLERMIQKFVVTAIPTLPVTNCDPTIPNGAASASVNGDVDNYTFDWYEGVETTPAGSNFITQGPEASNLKSPLPPANVFYTVVATNKITQCDTTATVQVKFEPLPIPPPLIDVVGDVTKCIVPNEVYVPDGSLRVVVDRPVDFIFTWTKEGDASFTASTEIIENLYEGIYTVEAFNKVTHCSSKSVGTIGVNRLMPAIDFKTLPASCGEPDGFASIFLTNTAQLGTIVWTLDGQPVSTEPIIYNVGTGLYHVLVTSDKGCTAEMDVPIATEVHPYNGISRNSDGQNDLFYIGCIESFKDNNVKIFNRAGTLVYEANYYRNDDNFFDGKSNKGVSVMGTNLPDGTYFYIIDKRDGSKRLAGYLEIVN